MSDALEVISKTGTATWDQLKQQLGLSAGKLGPVLSGLLEAGHIDEDPQFTYHVAGQRPEGENKLRVGRQVKTADLLNGLCPFRPGNVIKLDDRCPETMTCVMSFGRAMVTDYQAEDVQIPIPVLRQGTYCRTCVDDGTREKEIGKSVSRRRA